MLIERLRYLSSLTMNFLGYGADKTRKFCGGSGVALEVGAGVGAGEELAMFAYAPMSHAPEEILAFPAISVVK